VNSSEPFGSQYWLELGVEKHHLASRMKDPLAKAALIRLSKHYAELAKRADGSIDTVSKIQSVCRLVPEALVPVAEL
jgi:hypothetical protein